MKEEKSMAKRMPIGLFVDELVAALNRGDGYIMGARGQNPRTGYLDLEETKEKDAWKEDGWYYTQYSGSKQTQALKWRKSCTRVWDCNGMAEGIYEIWSGTNIDSKARFNYADWCSVKGTGMIPENRRVPGAAVFWSDSGSGFIHHVAYLWKPVKDGHPEGDWYIIEARGVMYGVVKSKLLSRKPNFWGYMDKYFDYASEVSAKDVADIVELNTLGSRALTNGCEGADVKELQLGLIRMGYDLGRWGADGDFGDHTEMAVKHFQRDHDLDINGEFDAKTLAEYEAAVSASEKDVEDPVSVEIVGGDCYIRSEASAAGKKLGIARKGEVHAYAGEISQGDWYKINLETGEGWVSGKYSKLRKYQ